jgi:hypothetical protein
VVEHAACVAQDRKLSVRAYDVDKDGQFDANLNQTIYAM